MSLAHRGQFVKVFTGFFQGVFGARVRVVREGFYTGRSCVMRKLAFVAVMLAGFFPLAGHAQENPLLDREF